MGKLWRYCIIFFTTTLIIGALAASTKYISQHKKDNSAISQISELEPVKKQVNGITVSIDPRMELLAAVQLIGNYDDKFHLMTKLDFSYKEDMKNYFSKYSTHKIIKTFNKMSNEGFSFSRPPEVMLYLSNPQVLSKKKNFGNFPVGGIETASLDKFISELQEFAEDSKFDKFYLKNKEFYIKVLERAVKSLEATNYISEIEQYYGMNENSYNIIISPLFHPGGFGPKIKNENGKYDIYSIQGPMSVETDIPVFGDKSEFRELVWHEFSHSFVNPIMEDYTIEINKYSKLFEPIAKQMTANAYGNWEGTVNEHIIRAVTSRLTLLHDGKTAYDTAIIIEKSRGFYYVEELANKLEEYENNRTKYKSFKEFYPELITVFKDLSEKEFRDISYTQEFKGMNSIYSMNIPLVIIVPTNEKDEKIQEEIQIYSENIAGFIKDKIKLQTQVMTDKVALQEDLSEKNIIAYGTIEGNLWLKNYSKELPFKIEEDKLSVDKTYSGSSLRFITGIPNPVNKTKGMIIYTAQKAEDIININSVVHGSTDFVVAEGSNVIGTGNYIK